MIPQAPFIQWCLWYNSSLPQLKGFREHPSSVPANLQGPECSQGTQLCPPHHTQLRVTNKRTSPRHCCGPAGALGVPPGTPAVSWRWIRNFQMENNLQVILSFSSDKWGWKISVFEQWWGLGAPSALSLAKDRDKGVQESQEDWKWLWLPRSSADPSQPRWQTALRRRWHNCHRTPLEVEFREWGIQTIPFSLGKSCSFPLLPMGVWGSLSQGCGTPRSELAPDADPVPFLLPPAHFCLFCTHLLSVCWWPEANTIFLKTPWSEMTHFWALLSTNLFDDGEEKKIFLAHSVFYQDRDLPFAYIP